MNFGPHAAPDGVEMNLCASAPLRLCVEDGPERGPGRGGEAGYTLVMFVVVIAISLAMRVPAPPLCLTLKARGNDRSPGRAGLDIVPAPNSQQRAAPRTMSCRATLAVGRSGTALHVGGRPPAYRRRGHNPTRYTRATTPMVRRWVAAGGPEGRG